MDCRRLISDTEEFGTPYKSLLLIGPPGAGKGTQGKAIASRTLSFYFSLGDLYRSFHKRSALGIIFEDFASTAKALPDSYATSTCIRGIQANVFLGQFDPTVDLLILDGFPKTSGQFLSVNKFLSIIAVIHLRCCREESFRRISARQQYSSRHEDLNSNLTSLRIGDYEVRTKPLLNRFRELTVPVIDIDAEQSTEQVTMSILRYLCTITDLYKFINKQCPRHEQV